MSVFVTGTDTDVGKTVVSAVLLARYSALAPAYWKPISTGGVEESDSRRIASLAGPTTRVLPEAFSFDQPVSPHLAAKLEGRMIQSDDLADSFRTRLEVDSPLVIEGIGGLLVPLNDDGWLLADFLADTALPLVLVASTRVGTINHTLLTLEAARHRQLQLSGVVLNGPSNPSNLDAIERFGGVAVIGTIPELDTVDRRSIGSAARHFDPAGQLETALKRSGNTIP